MRMLAIDPDPVRVLGRMLAMAWMKYEETFGEAPHGTPDQMSSLVELAGGLPALRRFAAYTVARAKKRRTK